MSEKEPRKNRKITPKDQGFFHDIANQIKLIGRLLADPRVNPLLKLMPVSTLLYFIVPDLVPGPVDDALIIGIGTYMFVELCPPEIVQEHKDALQQVVTTDWHDPAEDDDIKEENIVEGEFHDEE